MKRKQKKSAIKKIAGVLFIRIPLILIAFTLVQVLIFKWAPVTYTPLMLKRSIQFSQDKDYKTTRDWVCLEDISPNMIRAVMASEDSRFLEHHGFDFKELQKMMDEHMSKGKKIRGCSTISQQTAKNCFTFCSDTWLRKGIEAYYTVLIELIWGKSRIMEVYLNIAETGKGLFGVEASALHYYGRHASTLTLHQAAAIACTLPNPLRRTPPSVSTRTPGRVGTVMKRAQIIDIRELVK